MNDQNMGIRLLVGCQRSGTNLLASLVGKHSDWGAPDDDDRFLPLFASCLHLAGSLDGERARRALADSIFAYLWVWEARDRGRVSTQSREHGLFSVYGRADTVVSRATSFEAMVCELLKVYSDIHGKAHTFLKVAMRSPPPFRVLDRHLPRMKLVHIVRDGRDVAASWKATYFRPRTMAEAGMRWSRTVRECVRWGHANPERYLEVRYEDLLVRTDAVLDLVIAFFCGHRKDATAWGRARDQNLAARPWLSKLSEPVDRANRGKWRTLLSPDELREFTLFAGSLLQELGYGPYARGTTRLLWPLKLRAALFAVIHPIFWRRALADVLPTFLLAMARVGVPVSRLLVELCSRSRKSGASTAIRRERGGRAVPPPE